MRVSGGVGGVRGSALSVVVPVGAGEKVEGVGCKESEVAGSGFAVGSGFVSIAFSNMVKHSVSLVTKISAISRHWPSTVFRGGAALRVPVAVLVAG